MSLRAPLILILAGLAALGGAPADAQLLPSPSSVVGRTGLPLPQLPLADRLAQDVDGLADSLNPDALAAARLDRLAALVRTHPRALELDDQGQPVVRGEVLAVSPTPEALAKIAAAGFAVARQARSDELGLSLVTLTPPKGLSARAAVRRLRDLDPGGDYDFNHVYADAGLGAVVAASAAGPAVAGESAKAGAKGGASGRAGLLDGGVAADQPVFTRVRLEQRGFADGGARPSAHGTATASLIAAEGVGQILVADVYGKGPAGGSASAIVGALSWMAQARAPVINISLVGPPNGALGAAVKALLARGCLIVAAVGNDGPAAPALYPASYPG